MGVCVCVDRGKRAEAGAKAAEGGAMARAELGAEQG